MITSQVPVQKAKPALLIHCLFWFSKTTFPPNFQMKAFYAWLVLSSMWYFSVYSISKGPILTKKVKLAASDVMVECNSYEISHFAIDV